MDNLNYRNNVKSYYNLNKLIINDNSLIKNLFRLDQLMVDTFIKRKIFKKIGEGQTAIILLFKIIREGAFTIKWSNLDISKDDITKINSIVKTYNKINEIIKNDICPNFIYTYKSFNGPFYLLLEYCDGTLNDLIDKLTEISIIQSHIENIIKSIFIQLLMGILCMQKIIYMVHIDLRFKNILYKNIDKNIIFYYNINGKIYEVKTYGILVIIIDFDGSRRYSNEIKMNNDFYKLVEHNNMLIKPYLKKLVKDYNVDKHDSLSFRLLVDNKLINMKTYNEIQNIYKNKSISDNKKFNKSINILLKSMNNKQIKEILPIDVLNLHNILNPIIYKIFIKSYKIPIETILYEQFNEYLVKLSDDKLDENKKLFTMTF